jgi:hypothetical protein
MSIHSERILIMDMEELTASHVGSMVALGLIQSMAIVDQRHFPGTLHRLIVVNAPWLFQQVFGLVSSWLVPETAARFQVLGDPLVEDSVRKELLLDIDEANLPRRYGGTSTIGLPRLHWRLRQGSGTRIDGEKELVVSSGETVTMTVPLGKYWEERLVREDLEERLERESTGSKKNGMLTFPSLLIRSLGFNVQVEVCVLKKLSDAMTVPLPLMATETIECQEMVHRKELKLNVGAETEEDVKSYVALVLTFDHSAMWRQRTVFVELEGVAMP